jgi:hypothetical protein
MIVYKELKGRVFMRIFLLINILTLLFTFSAMANDFTVQNVKVDQTGASAIEARENGMIQARRNAFNVLKGRLGMAETVQPDDGAIATMVDSFEINREKSSQDRYLASVNVNFNQRAVQSYAGRMAANGGSLQNTASDFDSLIAERADFSTATTNRMPAQQSRVQMAATQNFKMLVPVNSVAQWVKIQNRLQSIPQMQTIQLNSLSAQFAVVTLLYAGDGTSLQRQMNGMNMRVFSNPNQTGANDAPYILQARG